MGQIAIANATSSISLQDKLAQAGYYGDSNTFYLATPGVSITTSGGGGGGNASWPTNFTSFVPTSTVTIASGGTGMGCNYNGDKKPNIFYQYEMWVVDLSHSETKNDQRILFYANGEMELADGTCLRDAAILKHSKELSDHAGKADVKIVVEQKHQWPVQPKN